MTTATDTANEFLAYCKGAALTVTVNDREIVTVHKDNIPGDRNMYMDAENNGLRAFAMLPSTRPGSIWVTTSDSVGGAVGLDKGYVTLHMSGVSKRVLTALRNMIAAR